MFKVLWARWLRHRAESKSLSRDIDASLERFQTGMYDCQLARITREEPVQEMQKDKWWEE